MERMRTYSLYRIDTNEEPLLGFVKSTSINRALVDFNGTVRAQQIGTIMEIRRRERRPVTISNDIDHIYIHPEGGSGPFPVWP